MCTVKEMRFTTRESFLADCLTILSVGYQEGHLVPIWWKTIWNTGMSYTSFQESTKSRQDGQMMTR